jgi:hypothetical protein
MAGDVYWYSLTYSLNHDSLSKATLPGTARQGKCAPYASAVRVSTPKIRDASLRSERHRVRWVTQVRLNYPIKIV